MKGEKLMDYLHEAIHQKLMISPNYPDLQIIHCHPETRYKLTDYLCMYSMNAMPLHFTEDDVEINIFGVKCKINTNRYMIKDEFKVCDEIPITMISERMSEREYLKFDPTSENLEWKHMVSVKIAEKVEVINADCFWSLTPPDELADHIQRKLIDRVNFLTAKDVPIKLFRTNDSYVIAVEEDFMYSYFFSEGVNKKTLKKAGDYALSKIFKKINNFKYD